MAASASGDGEGVEGSGAEFNARVVGVPVVEAVVVALEEAGDFGAIAMLGFAEQRRVGRTSLSRQCELRRRLISAPSTSTLP